MVKINCVLPKTMPIIVPRLPSLNKCCDIWRS
jgi:hypothetical protein